MIGRAYDDVTSVGAAVNALRQIGPDSWALKTIRDEAKSLLEMADKVESSRAALKSLLSQCEPKDAGAT
jgi:hypothetical protein